MLNESLLRQDGCQNMDLSILNYQEILNNAPIGVSVSTPDGRFVLVNSALARMFGYDSPQEMIDSVTDIPNQLYADPMDREKMHLLLEKSEEMLNHECRFLRRDGSLFWGFRSIQAIRDSQGNIACYQGFVSDITEKKRAELELEATRKEMSVILDTVPVMVWYKDVQGRYIHANRLFCKTVGIELKDLKGRTDFDINSKCVARKCSQDDQKVITSGRPLKNISERHKKSAGQLGWSLTEKFPCRDDQGGITGTIGFALDVTEAKRTEKDLRESEKRFQTLVENLPIMINAGTKEGLFTYWNKACEEITGYSSREIIGNPEAMSILYPESDLGEQILSEWKKELSFKNRELALTARDGSVRHILWSNLPPEITFSGIDTWAVGVDVTESRQAETKMREYEALQRLLMNLATGFINISLEEVDKALNEMLETIGMFTRVDRAYIFMHDHVRQITRNTHEWCAEGVCSEIESLQEIPFSFFSEILEVLQKNKAFYIHDLAEISGNVDLRSHLQDQGIKSIVNIPLMHKGINSGFVGFDIIQENRSFAESEIGLLKVLAEIVSNVMARLDAEEKLRNSEKFLRDVNEGIPGAVFQFLMEDSGNQSIEYISSGIEEIYGKPALDIDMPLTLERIVSKVHPEDRDEFMASIHESATTLKPWEQELRIFTPEGKTKWVHAHSSPNKVHERCIVWNGVMMDITERKQAESRIREAHQTLLAILDNANSNIYVADMQSHEILFTNEAVRKTHGNVVGQKCWAVFQADQSGPCSFCTNSRLIDDQGRSTGFYHWECQNTKTKKWFDCQDIAIRWTDGHMVRLQAAIDITERKQAEEALRESRQRYEYLLESSTRKNSFHGIIGRSRKMQHIYAMLQQVAGVDTTVLITGETGTGKELIAEALHASSPRSNAPLIKVNCLTLSEELLDSELFGHVRGAFTGAYANKIGRVEAAEGGTLFLDEIGDLTGRIQLKLLRFLQEKEYERVGESKTRRADVRIVAATNADLAAKIEEGNFRRDLYYRLKVIHIRAPGLRERGEDIPMLIHHFCRHFAEKFDKPVRGVSTRTMRRLREHTWPGNVRELEHVLEHGTLLCPGGLIEPEHLPDEIFEVQESSRLQESVGKVDKESLADALRTAKGKKTEAARILGISRRTLYRKLHRYGLL